MRNNIDAMTSAGLYLGPSKRAPGPVEGPRVERLRREAGPC
jgi:hypothetical protein